MKCCLLLLLLSGSAAAQTFPTDAAALFVATVDRGDPSAVAAMIDQQPDQHPQAIALARNLIAARHLADAMHARFGQAADPSGLNPLPTTQALSTANLAADESHATLQTANGSIALIRRGDDWKVRLLDDSPATVQQLWLTNHLTTAMVDVTHDLQGGKYAGLDEARHALQLSMGAAVTKLMVNDSATTKPTTTP